MKRKAEEYSIVKEEIFRYEEEIETNMKIVEYCCSIGDCIKKLDSEKQYFCMKMIEHMFDSESDTILGDFINDFVMCIFDHIHKDSFHIELQSVIDESNCNLDMLEAVSKTMYEFVCSV